MVKFSEIPQMTERGNYKVDVSLRYLLKEIEEYIEIEGLILNPDFQRGHVWTEQQQIDYVEYLLQGGKSGRDIYLNFPSRFKRIGKNYNDFVVVDGLQRLTALMKFLKNELKVFGQYYDEFEDKPSTMFGLVIYINDLKTKEQILKWYLEMNTGGTPHSKEEIERVRKMWEKEKGSEKNE